MEATLIGEFCCQAGSIWTLLAHYLVGGAAYSVIAKTRGNAKRARFGCFWGQSRLQLEGSKDHFESHIPSVPPVHAVHAQGSPGSPLSTEPFLNSDD
jgi:hypothetical protein